VHDKDDATAQAVSHHEAAGLIPDYFMQDSQWLKWYWTKFFSKFLQVSLLIIPPLIHIHQSLPLKRAVAPPMQHIIISST
jgi:hypothetical protein